MTACTSHNAVEVELQFDVVSTDADRDFSILRLDRPSAPVPFFPMPTAPRADASLWGRDAAVVHGNFVATNSQFLQHPDAISGCNIFTVHRELLFYTAATSAGDSGGALLLLDGQLVGMHKEGVNDVVAVGASRKRRKTPSEAGSPSTSAAALRLDCQAVLDAIAAAR